MKRKRILLSSCSVIVACMAVVIGMTWALFTDSLSVKNHLQAGDLSISLRRTNLEYCVLGADGKLAVNTIEEDLDFTEASENNIFGIDAQNMLIVPQSYFTAEMELINKGNVAFTYDVAIKLEGAADKLAGQLEITVTGPNGSQTIILDQSKESEKILYSGEMLKETTTNAQKFTVTVKFLDDKTTSGINNNLAQGQNAIFDLTVTATQYTAPTTQG